MDAVEAVARALWVAKGFGVETLYQHHEWEDWPTDKQTEHRDFGGKVVVTLMHYGWRKMTPLAQAALSAARPFIAAECAKGEFNAGQAVIYTPFGEEGFHATFEGYIEGWPNLRFKDGSTCIVRPSRVIATAIKETIR